MKYIALLDCNNFFVSCERLFRPDLLKRPVVVLSSNDGCVIARSKEIKDKGIPMGVPYFQIKDILEDMKAVAFSSHFSLYRDISRRVFDVVRTKFNDIEQYSIDECFFSFDSDNPEQVALSLKQEVERLVGIPVSVGVAFSKTQAKYMSTVAKKTHGTAVLTPLAWDELKATIRLSELWGVGINRFRQFEAKGIVTVADLLRMAISDVDRLFGLEGVRLYGELYGKETLPILNIRPGQKSIMNTRSFSDVTTDISVLGNAVKYHVEQGVKDLVAMGLLATSIRVMIAPSYYGDFALHGASKESSLIGPTANLFTLQQVAVELLSECFKPGIPYKKAGVIMSGLVQNEVQTPSLFAASTSSKDLATEVLSETVMNIQTKHGRTSLQLGFNTESTSTWQGRRSALSPAYTTHWTEIKVVRT
jgi:DNA polymerase V